MARRPGIPALLLLVLALPAPPPAALAAAPPPAERAAAPAPPALTADERREVTDWLNRFRRARDEPERQVEAVDKVLALGPPAAAQLLAALNKELGPLQATYRADFLQATTDALRDRFKVQDPKEIDALRETVLALGKDDGLTKEKIVATADPAMARLNELLIVGPETVLQGTPALQAQRDAMLGLAKHWQRVTDYLASHAAASGDAAPPAARRFEDILKDQEALSALLALARNDAKRKVLLANADLAPRLDTEEARGIRDLNRMRLLLGLKPLRIDVALCDAARDHAKDMVTLRFFAHNSPVAGKASPWDRAKRFGTSAGAENIAAGASTGPDTNQQWFHSPGHHKNMLGDHSRIGLGRYAKTWTQMFG